MVNMKKKYSKKNNIKKSFFCGKTFFILLLILISGCKGKKDAKQAIENVRTGSEGIAVSFLKNNPPDVIHVESGGDNTIKVVLQLNNKGAYPQPNEAGNGKIYLSGFDRDIIKFNDNSKDLGNLALEGKSTINPNGGIDFVTFNGIIEYESLNVDKYEPTLLATACYLYHTVAGPQVCIDPDPYSTITQKKVCEIKDTSLSNQGAPVAVTKIVEEALATKTQFKITIKNVGSGDVIKRDSGEKCDPTGDIKLEREDINKVYVREVKIGNKDLSASDCKPFAEDKFIRLINGEGSIICELAKSDYGASNTAYTTPLKIELSYFYKNTAERKLQIKKESSSTAVSDES